MSALAFWAVVATILLGVAAAILYAVRKERADERARYRRRDAAVESLFAAAATTPRAAPLLTTAAVVHQAARQTPPGVPCPFCVGRLGRVVTTCEDCQGSGVLHEPR